MVKHVQMYEAAWKEDPTIPMVERGAIARATTSRCYRMLSA